MQKPGEPIRIQKYLSQLGVATRREVEAALEHGEIRVNGELAQPGDRVIPGFQRIDWRGKAYQQPLSPSRQTIALHKPAGVLSSHSDPHEVQTVISLLPTSMQHRKWILAGRLDRESEGLILLSEDGDLVHRITHPSHQLPKYYRVWFTPGPWGEADRRALLEGMWDEGEFLQAAEVSSPRRAGPHLRVDMVLRQGHKREIRRMMRARGKTVQRLVRTRIGGVFLQGLRPGQYRTLTPEELATLREPNPAPKKQRPPKPRSGRRGPIQH